MKKKWIIASICTIIAFALVAGIYWYYHPTHYAFNDRFILDSTEDQIVERYGAFSKERRNADGTLAYGAYVVRDNTPELIMSYDDSLWYEIYFKNGVAYMVRLQEGQYGG